MPRLSLLSARAALARPAVLVTTTSLALAALLGGGLLVASATDAGPMADAQPSASPGPAGDGTGSDATGSDATGSDGSSGSTTSGGDDNVAVARNTRDGSTVYAIRLKVSILNSDPSTVDSGNAAVAAASCTDCQTVAIALEGIVVTGDAENVSPENIALAINSGCSNCQTLAYAYQNLQTVDGKARMTGDGRRRVAELRQQLQALRTSDLDIFAVKAEVDRIAGEFAQILRTTIVPLGQPGDGTRAAAGEPRASDAPSPTSSPSTTQATPPTEPSPVESAEPTPTASDGPASAASPTSASPEPALQ